MTKLATSFNKRTSRIIENRNTPLSEGQLRHFTPAVFAPSKHSTCSERYSYIPTNEILDALRAEGFQPFFACQSTSRDEGKIPFTKHMLRLRRPSTDLSLSARAQEIVLIGSHDKTSSLQIFGGYINFLCLNKLVCGDILGEYRLHHSRLTTENVIEGVYEIVDRFSEADRCISEMQNLTLPEGKRQEFFDMAMTVRYGNLLPFDPDLLRFRKRSEQKEPTLWNDFNQAQEWLIRGGIACDGRKRVTTSRPVNNIRKVVEINRNLWDLAESYLH